MYLANPVSGALIDFSPFSTRTESDPTHQLGALVELGDRRSFRYAKAGASNISKGKLQIAPAPKANHANISVSVAAASGATRVNLTPGATAVVAGEYDEGFMAVNDVDGEGQVYKISNTPAANASTAFNLDLYDQIATALTTNSQVTLVHNAYNACVEAAVATRRVAGVPLVGVSAGDFCWLQTHGVAATLIDGAIAVGNAIVPSDAVAGAVEQQDVFVNATDATRLDAKSVVGRASIVACVDTEYNPVVLCID